MFNKGKYNAIDIANWFLNENRKQMNFEDSEFITNLKLQKRLSLHSLLIKIAHFLCRNFLLFHQNFFEENQVQEFCLLV